MANLFAREYPRLRGVFERIREFLCFSNVCVAVRGLAVGSTGPANPVTPSFDLLLADQSCPLTAALG